MTERLTIATIKEKLKECTTSEDPFIQEMSLDQRKGVQKLLAQWQKQQEKKQAVFDHYQEMLSFEKECLNQGYRLIAGIDEVGRGPLAGPVVSAAVILDVNQPIYGLDDSKKLNEKKRNELYEQIQKKALGIGIGVVSEEIIDEKNIYESTKLAMIAAIESLPIQPDFLLLDAMQLNVAIPQKKIIKGDAKSVSIAAASIIAKVTRDQMMVEYDQMYPGYGFAQNAGYGTKEHLAGIELQGICPIHRKSFAPIKNHL